MKKFLLQEPTYSATCVAVNEYITPEDLEKADQRYKNTPHIELVWMVDTGSDAYHTIFDRFPYTKSGLENLEHMMDRIGLTLYPERDEFFATQFIGIRTFATVTIINPTGTNLAINKIIKYDVAIDPPEYDVTKPKKDDHYFQGNKKKKLPINSTNNG